jgi:TetR/AcrR family transcriptional regulator, regulator of autoinduction and epiphytic fitness
MTPMLATQRKSFRAEQFELREQAILGSTNRLLAQKGYDSMAMDDIAADVGIAKGSLYKHFSSKEELAAAVMINLLRRTREKLDSTVTESDPLKRIRSMLTWVLTERLSGGVPLLPSTSPALQKALTNNQAYMGELVKMSDAFGELITHAQEQGKIRKDLSSHAMLFTIYARTCDPTADFLKLQGQMTSEQIVQYMVDSCFGGLEA